MPILPGCPEPPRQTTNHQPPECTRGRSSNVYKAITAATPVRTDMPADPCCTPTFSAPSVSKASMTRACIGVFVFGILALVTPAAAQTTAMAARASGEINGRAWSEAQPITAFVQRDPTEGAPPTYRTEARVLYDDTAIYI